MKLFEFDKESKYYKPDVKNVDADERLHKKALEEAEDGGFEFGEFFVQVPSSDAEAKEMAVSVGAAGMDPFIEDALNSNDPDLFRNAALDLEMIMPSIENHLMNNVMDERLVNVFMHDINEIYHWMRGGYKKTLAFADGKWQYADMVDESEQLDEGILQDIFNFLWVSTGKFLDKLPVIGKKREEARIKAEYDNFVQKMDSATTEKWLEELAAELKSQHHATKSASKARLGLLRRQVEDVKNSSSPRLFILHMRQLRRTLADFRKFVKKSNKGLADRKRKAKALGEGWKFGDSCYDCGSTIAYHHTPSCEMAAMKSKMDLPEKPGTQYWTGEVPPGLESQVGTYRLEYDAMDDDIEEAIVPWDQADGELNWIDDETGELFKHKPGSPEDEAEKEAAREKQRIRFLQPAIQDMQKYVGDMAVGGADPIDYLITQHYYDIEELDDAAQAMGFKDAQDYVDSYLQTEGRSNQYHIPDVKRHSGLEGHVTDLDQEKRIKATWNNFLSQVRSKGFDSMEPNKKADLLTNLSKLRRIAGAKGIELDWGEIDLGESIFEAGNEFTQAAEMLYNERPDLFRQHGDEYMMGVLDDVLKRGEYGDLDQVVAATIHKVENSLADDDYIGEILNLSRIINTK